MADFNPDAYIAQKSGAFNPDEYLAEKGKVTVEAAPDEEAPKSTLPKLGTLNDAAKSAERMAIAIAKPPAAIAEMVGWGAPAKQLLERDAQLKEEAGLGGTLSSVAGDVAGYFMPAKGVQAVGETIAAVPKVAQLLSKVPGAIQSVPALANIVKDPLAKLSATGAAGTLLNPIGKTPGEEGYLEERGNQGLFGAAAGPAIGSVFQGAAKVLSPQLKRLQELKAQGIDIDKFVKGDSTLGQVLGGPIQSVENFLQALPFSGVRKQAEKGRQLLDDLSFDAKLAADKVKQNSVKAIDDTHLQNVAEAKAATAIQNQDMDARLKAAVAKREADLNQKHSQFSTPIIDKSLSHIGEKLDPGVTGAEAIAQAQQKISNAYESSLAKMGDIRLGDDLVSSLDKVKTNKKLGSYATDLEEDIANLKNLGGDARLITPKQWQAEFQDLSTRAYEASISGDLKQKAYGRALKELKDTWMDLIENQAGSEGIKAANKAHAAFQAPQKAAAYLDSVLNQGGKFNPRQLLQAIKAGSSEKRFAAGQDEMQKEALAAYEKMAQEKAALKAQHDKWDAQLKNKKSQNNKQIEEVKKLSGEEKYKQKQSAVEADKKAKNELNSLVGNIKKESTPSGILNKIGYVLAAAPAAKVATAGAGMAALGPAALQGAALAGIPGPLARLLYQIPSKSYKNLATAPKSEMAKKSAEDIRNNLPTIGGLGGYTTSTNTLPELPEDFEGNLP